MSAYGIRLDPAGSPLTITSSPYFLTSLDAPEPPLRPQYVSAFGTDGAARIGSDYDNRTITVGLRVSGTSDSNLEDQVQLLQAAITKMHREGGVLELTTPAGTVVNATVLDANMSTPLDRRYMSRQIAEPTLTFTCSPLLYGSENSPSDNVSTTSYAQVFTVASVAGDVPALGRLVVDNDDATYDQLTVAYGVQSKNYSADATAALSWDAYALSVMNAGAAKTSAPTGYSGSGTIYANALTTEYQDVLKSTVTTTYFSHIGRFRVLARAQTKSTYTGTVTLRASYSQADVVNFTQNDGVDVPSAGSWGLLDLGIVNVSQVTTGTQRWELRVQAKGSVTGDGVYVDAIVLMPVDESYGLATGSYQPTTTLTAQDSFTSTTAGNLNTKSLVELGGTWSESSAGKFTIDTTNKATQRTGTGDTAGINNGAWATTSGSSGYAGQSAQVDLYSSTSVAGLRQGVILRYVSSTKFIAVVLEHVTGTSSFLNTVNLVVFQYDGTTLSELFRSGNIFILGGASRSVYGAVTSQGKITAILSSGSFEEQAVVTSNAAGPSGTLATGSFGIIDHYTAATPLTRRYDNFLGYTVVSDAVAFKGGKSVQFRYDGVVREDSGGGSFSKPASYEGDYLLVPASGRESRTCRVIVKASRTWLNTGGDDDASPDTSAKLYVTPRYLTIPT